MKQALMTVTALAMLMASVNAETFKTDNGKEYEYASVTRAEADGIVVRTKTGVSKLYFTELPKEVRERFHYDPQQAAAAQAAQAAAIQQANQQAEEINRQRGQQQQQQAKQAARQFNVQALVNAYQNLVQQEEELLAEIGRIKSARENARRKWVTRPWGVTEPQPYQYQTDADEANLPLLEGRLQNVRSEKQRVRQELDRAQHQSVIG